MSKLGSGVNYLLEKYVLLAVLLFPVMIVLVKSGGTTIFGVAAIISLFIFFTRAIKLKFTREEKLFFYSCLLIFLMAMFVSWLGGFDKAAWKPVSRMLNLMLAIPLYFLFKQYLRTENVVWWGLYIGVVLCGVVSIYEIATGAGRANGVTNAILFGDISMAMMAMLLVAATNIKKVNYKIVMIVLTIIVFGLAATLLSHSRGGWLVLPLLILVIGWQLRSKISTKSLSIVGLVLPLIAIAMYLMPATGVQERIDRTFTNIQKYSEGTGDRTSVGLRLEMWKTSWVIFKQQPVAGVGWGNYQETAKKLIAEKKVSPHSAYWDNPHSQYFSVLAAGGSLMLFALLLLFMVPLFRFKKLLSFNDNRINGYALAGIILILSYMVFALTESIFERSIPTAFFAFYIALFFAMANRTKEQKIREGYKRRKKLSVIIIAYNEVDRIEGCLLAVSDWADEIVVYDNGSTDGTIEVAKTYTDKVFVTDDWPGFGKQKQRALDKAQYEWVLSLDADEMLTPESKVEIDMVIDSERKENVYKIPMADIVYNKRLDFGQNNRAPKRLFKRKSAKFCESLVHEKVNVIDEKLGVLNERLLHNSFRNMDHAICKFSGYAWKWATERFEKGRSCTWFSALLHSLWKFMVNYFFRLGFLDGFRGLIMAIQMSMYTFNKYAILWLLNKKTI